MKFEEVLPALREGKKIRRKNWDGSIHRVGARTGWSDERSPFADLAWDDIYADDWEIVHEPTRIEKFCELIKGTEFEEYFSIDGLSTFEWFKRPYQQKDGDGK